MHITRGSQLQVGFRIKQNAQPQAVRFYFPNESKANMHALIGLLLLTFFYGLSLLVIAFPLRLFL